MFTKNDEEPGNGDEDCNASLAALPQRTQHEPLRVASEHVGFQTVEVGGVRYMLASEWDVTTSTPCFTTPRGSPRQPRFHVPEGPLTRLRALIRAVARTPLAGCAGFCERASIERDEGLSMY